MHNTVIIILTPGSVGTITESISQGWEFWVPPLIAVGLVAARSYDNVIVIDSENCSIAVGLLMLVAHKMMARGDSLEKIVAQIEKAKKRIKCAFVLDSVFFLRKLRPLNEGIAIFMRTLGVRAMIRYRNGGFKVDRYIIGGFDRYYKKFIDHMLPSFTRPDKNIVVVIYVDLTREQKRKIEAYIRKWCDF